MFIWLAKLVLYSDIYKWNCAHCPFYINAVPNFKFHDHVQIQYFAIEIVESGAVQIGIILIFTNAVAWLNVVAAHTLWLDIRPTVIV